MSQLVVVAGEWTTGKQSSEALEITDYNSIAVKLAVSGRSFYPLNAAVIDMYFLPNTVVDRSVEIAEHCVDLRLLFSWQHGDNWIKSAGNRRSLLQRYAPFGWPPPGRNPKGVPPSPESLLHHSDSVEP